MIMLLLALILMLLVIGVGGLVLVLLQVLVQKELMLTIKNLSLDTLPFKNLSLVVLMRIC